MNHEKSGMPSKGWLCAYLSKYMNQRASFELSQDSMWHKCLIEQGAMKASEPIMVSGVFFGLWKRPKNWKNYYDQGPIQIYLRFSKVIFSQGEVTTRSFLSRSHHQHAREDNEFELSEIRGLAIAERLRAMTPRLGHNPARLTSSERHLEKGFLSKKEPTLPRRGSDSSSDTLFLGDMDQ